MLPLVWMLPLIVLAPWFETISTYDPELQSLLLANMKSQPLPGLLQTVLVFVHLAPAAALWLVEWIPAMAEKVPPDVAGAVTWTVWSSMLTSLAVICSP